MDIKCIFILISTAVGVSGAGCENGQAVWCEKQDFQIVLQHMSQKEAKTAEDCQAACLADASASCKAVDYSEREGQCQLFNLTKSDASVETVVTKGVNHYWYLCNESCPTDEVEDRMFLQWLQDDPVWFALAGTGLLALLLFIIIIVLICRLKPNSKDVDN